MLWQWGYRDFVQVLAICSAQVPASRWINFKAWHLQGRQFWDKIRRIMPFANFVYPFHWITLKFCKKGLIIPLTSTANLLKICQFSRHFSERASQELWNALFCGVLSIVVSKIMARFRKIWNFTQFDLWWPLVTSIFTWTKKLAEIVSKLFLTSFRTFFFCFLLRRLGAKLDEGRASTPPPPSPADREVSEYQPGVG